MTAPATPNPGSSPIASFYNGLRLSVLGVASGVSLTANGHGLAFYVPQGSKALLALVVMDGFSAVSVDSGVTLSYGFTSPAFGELFSATLGAIVGKGVTDATITAGGSGYTPPPPSVTFTSSDLGRGAAGHAVLGGGAVTAVVIDNPGYGYVVAPTIAFGSGAAAATAIIGLAKLPPLPIVFLQPVNLALIAGGFQLQWAITNAAAGSGTCNITFLGAFI